MITKLQVLKSYYLLDKCNLTLGELQNGTHVERLVKKGRKPKDQIDKRPIVHTIRQIKATGIPASTLKRLQNREIKLGRTTARKLSAMYDRLMYQKLREAGANYKEARKLKSNSPDKIKEITSKYQKTAKKIQAIYEQKYHDAVKAFKKQERDKLKPGKPSKPPKAPPPSKPLPPPTPYEREDLEDVSFEDTDIPSSYGGADLESYLDEDEPELPEEQYVEPELKEPPPDDYPTLDEVLFGMGESDHLYSEWDGVVEAYGGIKH